MRFLETQVGSTKHEERLLKNFGVAAAPPPPPPPPSSSSAAVKIKITTDVRSEGVKRIKIATGGGGGGTSSSSTDALKIKLPLGGASNNKSITVGTKSEAKTTNNTEQLDPTCYLRKPTDAPFDTRKPDASVVKNNALIIPLDCAEKNYNTIVINATMPQESLKFNFNLAKTEAYKEKNPETLIYYHFRASEWKKKKTIVQNSFRNELWEKQEDKSITDFPITKGTAFEFKVQITLDGFLVYLDDVLKTKYAHRYRVDSPLLYLIIPLEDENYGDRNEVIIHSIWFGSTKIPSVVFPPLMTTM